MNFLQILQLLNMVLRILALLDDKGKETAAKTIADTINKAGTA